MLQHRQGLMIPTDRNPMSKVTELTSGQVTATRSWSFRTTLVEGGGNLVLPREFRVLKRVVRG